MKQLIIIILLNSLLSCYKDQIRDIPNVVITSPVQLQRFNKGDTIPIEFHLTSNIGLSAIKIVHTKEGIGHTRYTSPVLLDEFESNKMISYSGFVLTNESSTPGIHRMLITIFDKHNGGMVLSRDYFID